MDLFIFAFFLKYWPLILIFILIYHLFLVWFLSAIIECSVLKALKKFKNDININKI